MPKKRIEGNKLLDKNTLTDEYLQRASYLGTILPLLDIFYELIIDERLKKYDLNIVKEFWIYFGLFIFSILYYFIELKIELVVFFGLATIFTLIIFNLGFFKSRLVTNEDDEIDKFIKNIEEKDLFKVKKFIKEYRTKLKESAIEAIIDSKHGNNWIIYDYFLKYQKVSEKILKYIVENNKFNICGEDTYFSYLKLFKLGLSFDTYFYLVNNFSGNKKFVKILNLYNPSYNGVKSIFRRCAKLNQSFYLSVKQGTISSFIALFSFLITIISVVINYKQLIANIDISGYGVFGPLFSSVNLLFSIIIVSMIFFSLITFALIGIIKFFWFIIGLFTPNTFQLE